MDIHQILIIWLGCTLQTLLIIQNPRSALFYYGCGSMISSILLTSFYYIYFYFHENEDRQCLFRIKSLKDLLIKPTSPFLDDQILDEIFKSFKKQISIRILTEGNKYLITMFSLISYNEQGIYSIISLIGTTFLRFISSIIEQIHFQDIFSSIRCRSKRTLILNSFILLDKLIRLWIILSIVFVLLVVPYSSTIVSIYIGEKNSSLVLYFCLYLIEIFFNGIYLIQESFLQSMISNEQRNSSQLFSSLIYFVFSFVFIRWFGICGIILINSFHLFGRIWINHSLINRLTNGGKCSFYLSSDYVFFLFISWILLNLNEILIENSFGEFCFAIGFILIIICLTLNEEKELIHYFYCIYKLNQSRRF